jgi:hypothetical protein
MFAICRGMKWAHLPILGGLYDQDPDLLDKFQYLFRKIAEHEEAERQKEEAERKKQERKQNAAASKGRGRRR